MKFSVVTTVCDPPVDVLHECLESVRHQTHTDLEHVVVDDASQSTEVCALLDDAARADSRIAVIRRPTRGGIVAAGNDGLAAATGEFVALVDHDDVLARDALATMRRAMTAECDLAYSDHDLLRPDGRRADPVYKPDFSPERLRQLNYITHLVVARRSLVDEVGRFRAGFDGSQDHDLLLRLSERAREVVHVPEVLYHWRMASGSVALDPSAKRYAYDNGRRAVADHCERIGLAVDVDLGRDLGTYRVRRRIPPTSTSVLIASSGGSATVWGRRRPHLQALLDSLWADRDPIDEIIVSLPEGVDVADDRITRTVVHAPGRSPFATAAAAANGDVAIALDEAMILDAGSSVAEMIALLHDSDVAAVGAAQFRPDGCVHNGGFVVQAGTVARILHGWHRDHGGPGRVMSVNREVSAVDVVGSAWRVERLRKILALGAVAPAADVAHGPADHEELGVRACLDARAEGQRVLWTPFSSFTRCDPVVASDDCSDGSFDAAFETPERDPYYSPNLVPGRADWLELPGRAGAPPYTVDVSGRRHWS
jgi:O-antigen biosynthesis protein